MWLDQVHPSLGFNQPKLASFPWRPRLLRNARCGAGVFRRHARVTTPSVSEPKASRQLGILAGCPACVYCAANRTSGGKCATFRYRSLQQHSLDILLEVRIANSSRSSDNTKSRRYVMAKLLARGLTVVHILLAVCLHQQLPC